MEIEWEEGKFHSLILKFFKKIVTDYPMLSKTISWYLCLGFIFSIIIYSISWDSENQIDYVISLAIFVNTISFSIPVISFLISYKSFNKEHKILEGFLFSATLALVGLFLFKIVISFGFSIGLGAVSSGGEIDNGEEPELFDADEWSEKIREWLIPMFTAGLGSTMFALHSSINNSKKKSKKSKSQKRKQQFMIPDINQIGRLSPDGYEWVDMQDGTQWFRVQNSGVPYERYNPKK